MASSSLLSQCRSTPALEPRAKRTSDKKDSFGCFGRVKEAVLHEDTNQALLNPAMNEDVLLSPSLSLPQSIALTH